CVPDRRALVLAGRSRAAEAPALVPVLLADPRPQLAAAALELLPAEGWLSEAVLPYYANFLRHTFGARARALGWEAASGESDETALLRPQLLRLVGGVGGDGQLVADATR